MLCSFHHVKRIVGYCQSKMLRERFAAGISCLVLLVFFKVLKDEVFLWGTIQQTQRKQKSKKRSLSLFSAFFLQRVNPHGCFFNSVCFTHTIEKCTF